MAREDLFSLAYGSFEDEINLSTLYERLDNIDSQLFMKDGFFYISNSEAKKILKFTSFGDLLTIYYNDQYNSSPLYTIRESDGSISTLKTVQYPFNYPTFIAVSDDNSMYVVDSLADGRIEYDNEQDIALKNIVLHFNEKGEFIDYIGQEGANASPFPPISKIVVNSKNELVVFCKVRDDFRLYYYDVTGHLIRTYEFTPSSLPSMYKNTDLSYINIDSAFIAYSSDIIYIKADYYIEKIDESSNVKKGIEYDKTVLHIFDRQENQYIDSIDMPSYEFSEMRGGESTQFKRIYEMLEIIDEQKCFLLSPTKDGYAFATFDIKTKKTSIQLLQMPTVVYSAFHVSNDGILSALLATPDNVNICWWHANATRKEEKR